MGKRFREHAKARYVQRRVKRANARMGISNAKIVVEEKEIKITKYRGKEMFKRQITGEERGKEKGNHTRRRHGSQIFRVVFQSYSNTLQN